MQSAKYKYTKYKAQIMELRTLAVGEAEHLVVVEHGVHVLDPQRVHRAVEGDPVERVRVVAHAHAHQRGHEAVGPLLGDAQV